MIYGSIHTTDSVIAQAVFATKAACRFIAYLFAVDIDIADKIYVSAAKI